MQIFKTQKVNHDNKSIKEHILTKTLTTHGMNIRIETKRISTSCIIKIKENRKKGKEKPPLAWMYSS